jgi:hypothetical protein
MRVLGVIAAAGLVIAPGAARADSAVDTFAAAEKAFAANDKAKACPLYEEALFGEEELPWKSAFLASTKLGLCMREAGKLASAIRLYRRGAEILRANSKDKDNQKRAAAAEKVAAELEAVVSHLTIAVPEEARVEGLAVTLDDMPLAVARFGERVAFDGGSYTVRATAPGRIGFEQQVRVEAERDDIVVEVPVLEPVKVAPPPSEPEPPPEPEYQEVRTRNRLPAIIVGGAGVGALLVAGALDLSARSIYGDYEDDPTHPLDVRDRANARRDTANLVAIVGAVGVAAGAAMWVLWPAKVESRPLVTGDGAGVEVRFTFR